MVSSTSKESYRQLKLFGQDRKEREVVLQLLGTSPRPLNSREISIKTGIERTSITRCLHDLEKSDSVIVACIGKCRITDRNVKYYTCND
jgi:hypothetical protein